MDGQTGSATGYVLCCEGGVRGTRLAQVDVALERPCSRVLLQDLLVATWQWRKTGPSLFIGVSLFWFGVPAL